VRLATAEQAKRKPEKASRPISNCSQLFRTIPDGLNGFNVVAATTPPLNDRAWVIWLLDDAAYQAPLECSRWFQRQ
jgi:hypothetical protein